MSFRSLFQCILKWLGFARPLTPVSLVDGEGSDAPSTPQVPAPSPESAGVPDVPGEKEGAEEGTDKESSIGIPAPALPVNGDDDATSVQQDTISDPKCSDIPDVPGKNEETEEVRGECPTNAPQPKETGGRRKRRNGVPKPLPPDNGRTDERPNVELVCNKNPNSQCWRIFVRTDDNSPIEKVQHNGECMQEDGGKYTLPSFGGKLSVTFANSESLEFPLFLDKPLIFRMDKQFSEGKGPCMISSRGKFIAIAPAEWEREAEHIPVEPEMCEDAGFKAHYIFREPGDEADDIGYFCCEGKNISLGESGINLLGKRIFDNDGADELFVGDAPTVNCGSEIAWARVGEEKKNGWKGENFQPNQRKLSDILDSCEGRFFLRIYAEGSRRQQDSTSFRYLRQLTEIEINGETYTQNTLLLPSERGHHPTKIVFKGQDICVQAKNCLASPSANEFVVKPEAEHDEQVFVSGEFRSVDITLRLPRIWWRIKSENQDGAWGDSPVQMTHQNFCESADRKEVIEIRLPRLIKSVKVGLGDKLELSYPAKRGAHHSFVSIPLQEFRDYPQIEDLQNNLSLNVGINDSVLSLVKMPQVGIPTASVKTIGGYRQGRGFSIPEKKAAGKNVQTAIEKSRLASLPIDRRRKTMHNTNVEQIKDYIHAQ